MLGLWGEDEYTSTHLVEPHPRKGGMPHTPGYPTEPISAPSPQKKKALQPLVYAWEDVQDIQRLCTVSTMRITVI